MRRLKGEDNSFLARESATQRQHTIKAVVLDPRRGHQPLTFEAAKAAVPALAEHVEPLRVLATGFDAMTGSVARINIVGRGGVTLNDAWAAGPVTYLGLSIPGFPNLFNMTGPGSPSVLANMALHSELHVNWVADAIGYLKAHGAVGLEACRDATENWGTECTRRAAETLMPQANSWYMGANIAGKPRVFMPFVGGFGVYGQIIADVAAAGYKGFEVLES
jgi:cation diffusion facilitator CzcD-associated flavoprotein CzcO